MLNSERKKGEQHHIVIAAAAADEMLALRLWRALTRLGVSVSINDAHVLGGDAAALVAITSPAARESLAFSDQISAFRRASGGVLLQATTANPGAAPAIFSSARGEDGLLAPAPEPEFTGELLDSARSAEALAGAIAERVGVRTAKGGWYGAPRIGLAAAAALIVTAGALIWSVRDGAPQAKGADPLGDALLAALAEEFPTTPSGLTLLELADSLEAALPSDEFDELSRDQLTNQARLFHAIGEARDIHGAPEDAQRAFARAHTITDAILTANPDDPDAIFAHSQSAFWAGNSAYRAGDLDAAATLFEVYANAGQRLVQIEPENPLYLAELGHAANNLGVIHLARGAAEVAEAEFARAIDIFQGAPLQAGHVDQTDIANTRGWRSDALLISNRIQEAASERIEEVAAYEAALEQRPGDRRLEWALAHAQSRAANAAVQLGETDTAWSLLEPSVETAARLTREYPDDIRYARLYVNALRDRARIALWRGEAIRAQLLLSEGRNYIARVAQSGQNDARYLDQGRLYSLAAEIALAAGAVDVAQREALEAIRAGELALADGVSSARVALGNANFLHAESLRLAGDDTGAARSYRTAWDQLHTDEGEYRTASVHDLRARILFRLGRLDKAYILRDQLVEYGYQRIDFISFWAQADRPLSADTSLDTAIGDGSG